MCERLIRHNSGVSIYPCITVSIVFSERNPVSSTRRNYTFKSDFEGSRARYRFVGNRYSAQFRTERRLFSPANWFSALTASRRIVPDDDSIPSVTVLFHQIHFFARLQSHSPPLALPFRLFQPNKLTRPTLPHWRQWKLVARFDCSDMFRRNENKSVVSWI